jgi:hypothetical protein
MADFFADTFAGSGSAAGQSPDIGYGAGTWAGAGTLVKSGGYLTSPVGATSSAVIQYGSTASTYGNPQSVQVTFTWRSGPVVSGSNSGLFLRLDLDSTSNAQIAINSSAGVWTLDLGGSSAVVTVAADTDYVGVLTYDYNSSVNLSMFGTSVGGAKAAGDANGFRRFYVSLGGTTSIAGISAQVYVPAPTTFAGSAPMGLLSARGGGKAALSAPIGFMTVGAAGMATIYAPMGTLLAAGHDSTGENAFTKSAPMGTLIARGGARAPLTAPQGRLLATGSTVIVGTAALSAPKGVLVALGTTVGPGTARLHAPMGRTTALGGGIVAMLAPKGSLAVVGTKSASGSAHLIAPKGVLLATGTTRAGNATVLTAPMLVAGPYGRTHLVAPMGTLAAAGMTVVAVVYEAYAINLKPRKSGRPGAEVINEVTRYPDVPFDGQFMYRGNCYGWGPGGLYLIGGETDDTVPIPYVMRTHPDDFGSSEKKTMRSAYFGGRFGPDATITLISGKEGENAYPYTTPRGVVAQNHRQKFGRGIKDRYLAMEIAGEGAMELDNLDPEVDKLTRRI